MRDYTGWMRRDVFAGAEYARLLAELEHAQYEFIVANRHKMTADGQLLCDGRLTSGDLLHLWSRQYEYPYLAANLDASDRKLLDVGSGYGFVPLWLKERGFDVTCSDASDLREVFADTGVRFLQDDITATGIEEEFDCVACISVLEEVPEKERALENLIRLVKPGGKLVLTMDCALDRRREPDSPPIEVIYGLIGQVEKSLTCTAERIHFERTPDLITTDAFFDEQPWRLPWKHLEPAGYLAGLKRLSRLLRLAPRRSLAVFLGTWRKR